MKKSFSTDLDENIEHERSFLTNKEFVKMMRISPRCAQNWRNAGLIGFSQIGHVIYYRISDIQEFLQKYHKPAFAKLKSDRI